MDGFSNTDYNKTDHTINHMKLHNLKTLSVFLFLLVMLGSWKWIQRSDFGSVGRHRATGIAIGTKGYMGLGHYNGAGPNIVFSDWWEFDLVVEDYQPDEKTKKTEIISTTGEAPEQYPDWDYDDDDDDDDF